MKQIFIVLLFSLSIFTCIAAPPNLFIEHLFDGRYNGNINIETIIYINNGMYYRGFTIKGDAEVITEIQKSIERDRNRSSHYTFYQDKDGSYTSMQVINNDEKIYIGFEIDSPDSGFFYIQGKEKAFK